MKLNSTLRTTLIVICLIIIVLNLGFSKKVYNTKPMRELGWRYDGGGGFIVFLEDLLHKVARIGIIFLLSFIGLGFLLIFTKEKDEYEN